MVHTDDLTQPAAHGFSPANTSNSNHKGSVHRHCCAAEVQRDTLGDAAHPLAASTANVALLQLLLHILGELTHKCHYSLRNVCLSWGQEHHVCGSSSLE